MSKSDLILLKEKYNTSDFFIDVVDSLITKLVEYGYISKSKVSLYVDRILNNVDELIIGNKNKYDYKSGYYDANKKILYIQDEKNIPSVYLRLLYALTTTKIDDNVYETGFSITKLRSDSYKLAHINFGINRAVMANLVCKACELIPAGLQIVPTKKTYTHNFLGYNIESANNIYALEGKIFSEMCYVLNIDEEFFYSTLFFKNPEKLLNNMFSKKKFTKHDEFLKLFDNISRKYNTYNKLVFLSSKLNKNYLEYKKHALQDDVSKILKEQKIIEAQVLTVLSSISDKYSENDIYIKVSENISETIENLENEIKSDLVKLQDILAEQLMASCSNLPNYKYASKLKCFNNLLIMPNAKVNKEIQNIILNKLMPKTEVTGINLIQKIKYAIIQNILAEESYSNISDTFSFKNINNFIDEDNGTALVLLGANKRFSKLLQISGLNNSFDDFKFELEYLPLDNLKNIMNNSYTDIYIDNVETLFTALRNDFTEFSSLSIENVFAFLYMNNKYLTVYYNNNVYVIAYLLKAGKYSFTLLDLSEQYSVFGETKVTKNIFKPNLPILYKK